MDRAANILFPWTLVLAFVAIASKGADATEASTPDEAQSKATSDAVEQVPRTYADPVMPNYRILTTGFNASERDIRRLLDSTGRELWRFFPDYEIEPFVVRRGNESPIVWHERNARREIVMLLNTGDTYWSQYAYQFAHEFCHILCRYDNDYKGNQWFEEAFCETASLFTLRAMARAWEHDPPYPHWRSYGKSLDAYAADLIKRNGGVARQELLPLFRKHEEKLRTAPKHADVYAQTAVVLLEMMEKDPQRWESVRWLNSSPSPEGETIAEYLAKWEQAVPEQHKGLVAEIGGIYKVKIDSPQQ